MNDTLVGKPVPQVSKVLDRFGDLTEVDQTVSQVVLGFQEVRLDRHRGAIRFHGAVVVAQVLIGQAEVVVIGRHVTAELNRLFKALGRLGQFVLLGEHDSRQMPDLGAFGIGRPQAIANAFRLREITLSQGLNCRRQRRFQCCHDTTHLTV